MALSTALSLTGRHSLRTVSHTASHIISPIFALKKLPWKLLRDLAPCASQIQTLFFFIFNFLFHHKAMEIRFLTELINKFFFSKERKPAIVDVCASNSFIEIKR